MTDHAIYQLQANKKQTKGMTDLMYFIWLELTQALSLPWVVAWWQLGTMMLAQAMIVSCLHNRCEFPW